MHNGQFTRFIQTTALVFVTIFFAGCFGDDSKSSDTGTAATSTQPPPAIPSAPITLQGSPAVTAMVGSTYSFQPTVSKSSAAVTFSVTGKPGWASFSAKTGALSGTPSAGDQGTTGHINITASNGSSTATLTPFTIRVEAADAKTGSIELSWNAPTENTDGSPISDLAGYHIYYGKNETDLTTAITVSGASTTSYTVSALPSGQYYFAIVAYNSSGLDSSMSNVASESI
jgi:hypothetical protein